ncbi:proprotein convertase P-domain-containing protein [Streptosporangium sp. NPDC000396]|uniref:proprotein convertase P-domain-containing protein n=1 Tax=Streptosporangium sp. NPDC000396 TaxID=3366185 RepID=UPI0036BDAEA7
MTHHEKRHRPRGDRILSGTAVLAMLVTLGAGTAQAQSASAPAAKAPTTRATDSAQVAPAGGVVPQLAEDGATVGSAALSGAASTATTRNVCNPGAAWLRLRFTDLELRGRDSLTVTGSAGGTFRFTGDKWRDRVFSTRALQGECVRVEPHFTDPASKYAVDGFQSGTGALTEADVVVAGAGDICGSACADTAKLINNTIKPAAVFTTGDNAYDSGKLSEYNANYKPTWGVFLDKTYPTPGNHEYNTSGASGYFDYYGARAGERGKGYYSWDIGDWHFIALNSNISTSAGSAQEKWLRQDLAANTKPCTAAYLHHPLFNVGNHGAATGTRPLWQALYDYKADLLLAGHDHNYQRWAPQDPTGKADANGIREILVGTGGKSFYSIGSGNATNLQVKNDNTHGALKLTLSSTGYRFDFVPIAGRTFTDSGSATCHKASTSPDFGIGADPAALSVAPGATGTSTVRVSSLNGFAAATRLTVTGQPTGVTATISPSSVTPAAGGTASATLNVSVAAGTSSGTHPLTVTGTSGSLTHTTTVQLTIGGGGGGAFSDDFESDRGWSVNPAGTDTATAGQWERGDPEETSEEGVKQLGTTVSGVNALVTGRLAGSGPGAADVDGGVTSVRSPAITLPAGTPTLNFSYNFAHRDNSGPDDYLRVKIVGTSTTTTVLERLGTASTDLDGAWRTATANLSAFAGQNIRILIEAADNGTASLVEAAIDDLSITSGGGGGTTFSNDTDFPVADRGSVESPVTVSGKPGNAPSAMHVNAQISHPYRGDLAVELVAPDGSVLPVRAARSKDDGTDLVVDATVDGSNTVANGQWRLRVKDTLEQDNGVLTAWSLTL